MYICTQSLQCSWRKCGLFYLLHVYGHPQSNPYSSTLSWMLSCANHATTSLVFIFIFTAQTLPPVSFGTTQVTTYNCGRHQHVCIISPSPSWINTKLSLAQVKHPVCTEESCWLRAWYPDSLVYYYHSKCLIFMRSSVKKVEADNIWHPSTFGQFKREWVNPCPENVNWFITCNILNWSITVRILLNIWTKFANGM